MLPKLTPLQSRLVASALGLVLILALYLSISSRTFAYAFDVDSIPKGTQHDGLSVQYIFSETLVDIQDDDNGRSNTSEPDVICKRQGQLWGLENNTPQLDNLLQGGTIYYVFRNSTIWGEKSKPERGLPSSGLVKARDFAYEESNQRSDRSAAAEQDGQVDDTEDGIFEGGNATRPVYITLNTCLQPNDPKDTTGAKGPPPQLKLYVSQSITTPGEGQLDGSQVVVEAQHGYANVTLDASRDVYIAVTAPNTTSYEGIYNVELAASIDAKYHEYISSNADLFFIDSDSSSALLATRNLTLTTSDNPIYKKWMELDPPYVVFANNQNDTVLSGVSHSYCGLEKYAQIAGTQGGLRTNMVQTSMTNVTLGSFPKQQFYFQGLNASSQYWGILAMTGNSTAHGGGVVGGGGSVWQTINFSTQTDGNCAVVFNLEFCSDVNYAVPGNPSTFPDVRSLAKFYDDAAAASYANFDKALQQIPCEIANTGQYSLARTCDDCAKAYKAWLCSVTIPRCQDYSKADPWLQPRNIAQAFPNDTMLSEDLLSGMADQLYLNSSRNPTIDEQVKPGPYKEILPCQDLCYNLVQSCPAALGFSCPQPGMMGFDYAYGYRPNGSANENGQITCNYPGAAYHLNSAGIVQPGVWMAAVTTLLILLL